MAVFEMWVWRFEQISWTKRITNEQVLERVREKTLLLTIRKRRRNRIGQEIGYKKINPWTEN